MARRKLDVHLWLPTLAAMAGFCLTGPPSSCQSLDEPSPDSSSTARAESQPTKPANVANADTNKSNGGENLTMTFQGRIVKSGNRFVLASTDNTTYQLDNQQRAHNFLNQNVKVSGDLDATTGTIHIHAIDPV